MAKNSKFIGIILLAGALGLMFWQNANQSKRAKAWQEQQQAEAIAAKEALGEAEEVPFAQEGAIEATTEVVVTEESADSLLKPSVATTPVKKATAPENTYVLENDLLKLTFTSCGGGLREMALKEYPVVKGGDELYTLVAPQSHPFLAFTSASELESIDLSGYKLVEKTEDKIILAARITDELDLIREYTLTTPEKKRTANGYLLKQKVTWVNRGQSALEVPAYAQNIGMALPTDNDPQHTFLNFGYYTGKDSKFIGLNEFQGGGFLFWSKEPKSEYQANRSIEWASVKNQFFTIIATPEQMGTDAFATPVKLEGEDNQEAIAGFIKFDSTRVEAGASVSQTADIYIGPKEFARINSLGKTQEKVMQWGWPIFAFFSKVFISMLNTVAKAVHNYGVAIVILTLLIRALMWPFTNAAAQQSKKMAKVQPALQALKEKYQDKPEKLQRETMKLFQEQQVNPLAGCLPALLQIPVFIGFFYMLRSAAELRFEQFLWISDLSSPDTVATIGGFPINIMPILMFVSMFFQIKLTPSSGDPQQRKIMMFTPFLFAFMLYGFSAGLTLYWTLSNVVSIIQQVIVNRQNDKENNNPDGPIDVETVKG